MRRASLVSVSIAFVFMTFLASHAVAQGRGGCSHGMSAGTGATSIATSSLPAAVGTINPATFASGAARLRGAAMQQAYMQMMQLAYLQQMQGQIQRQEFAAAQRAEMKDRQLASRRARREAELAARDKASSASRGLEKQPNLSALAVRP